MNAKLTMAKLMSAAKASEKGPVSYGFCVACGKKHSGVEPDARKYPCKGCGKNAVYGAEELLMS
jgi:hypothetical protein